MRCLTLLAIVTSLILWTVAIALPNGPTSFTLAELSSPEDHIPNGAAALRNAYLKYGALPPLALISRATVNGTVTATPTQYDTSYLIPVAIGSPPATYTMSLDTGSSDFSVYAPKLGGTTGSVSTTVTIGGMTVTKQPVTLNGDSSGSSNLVGMTYTSTTFYSNAVAQGIINPVFTADLKRGAPGRYNFGFIDASAYKGSITYITVNTANGFWDFSSNGYAIGTGAFVSSTIEGIVDTGTTLLLLPQSLVSAYYKQVIGAVYSNTDGGWEFPCSAKLPDLTIGIGSYRAIVPGTYLNYAPTTNGGSTCYGGLQPNTGVGFSIFGLPFIKSQFVVFKGTTSPTLGFAKKAV